MLKKILFVHYGDEWIRGSERCALDLMQNLDQDQYLPILWCNSNDMVKESIKLGISTEQDDFKRCTIPCSSLSKIKSITQLVSKAIKMIDDYGIDLIHINSVAPCQWMSIAARIKHIPVLGHYHTQYQTRERFLSLSHWVDEIVGVSRDVIKTYQNAGCNNDNCRVIYNGINYHDLRHQAPHNLADMFAIKNSDFSLLSVGSLVQRKGYDDLIKAIALLVKQGLQVKCVIVGGGPEKYKLKQLITRLALQHNVFLAGQRYDVGRFLNSTFDAFISASRNEAFGLANLEAAFCAKPVIAPDIDGLNEVFTANVSAELFASNEPEVIAQSIKKVIHQRDYLTSLQHEGTKLAYEKFTIERYVSQFEELYRSLLTNHQTSTPSMIEYLRSLIRGWQNRNRSRNRDSILQSNGDLA